jgi:hypothetical protein
MLEQAEVPGSSLPSGQSQKSSFTCERSSMTDGFEIQVNLEGSLKYLATTGH